MLHDSLLNGCASELDFNILRQEEFRMLEEVVKHVPEEIHTLELDCTLPELET